MTPRAGWLALAAVLVAGCALIPAATGQTSVPVSGSSSHLTFASGLPDLNAPPRGQIVFGSPLPVAEILPTSNASLGATLGLNHLLELAPNASDPEHPTVVAEAAPESLQDFNSTFSLHGTPYLKLIATLPVYRADAKLWTNGTTVPAMSGTAQPAILEVNYSVASGSDDSPGVLITWAVSGWPWVNPTDDQLALEYVLQIESGSGFATCSGSPSTDAPDATCSTERLAPGEAVWSNGLTALKGDGPSGSEAWVSWSPQVSGSGAAFPAVTAGAYYEKPGTSVVAISAPAAGATYVEGATLFLLSPGAALVATIVGDLPAYGGAAAAFALLAGIGIALSRRRNRAIARELAE